MAIMEIATAQLVLEYGAKAGRFISDRINADEDKRQAFIKGIDDNLGISEITKKIFGDSLNEMLRDAKKIKKIEFVSTNKGYISLKIEESLTYEQKKELLKAELAENLERLNQADLTSSELMNQSRMSLTKWIKKYTLVLHPSDENIGKVLKLNELLKVGKVTAKDIFKMIKPLFGAGAALSLIYVAMLATATGLGVWAAFTTYISGIPGGQVIGFTSLTILLAYLTLIPIKDENKIQVVINGIYTILDGGIEDVSKLAKKERDASKEAKLLNELDEKLEKENITKDRIILIATLLKSMILIDNNEHKKELIVLSDYLQNEFSLSKDEIDECYKIAPKIENLDTFLIDFKNNLENNEIKNIILVLKKIIVADSKISKEELDLLNKIKSTLE